MHTLYDGLCRKYGDAQAGRRIMLRDIRRRIYRKIRFKSWYRKAYYYHRKRGKQDEFIERFRGSDALLDRRYVRSLRCDMIRCLFRYGSYYDEYFLYGFEGRDAQYRASFITEGIRLSYYPRMNLAKNTDIFENKYRTYKRFQSLFMRDMIRIPKSRGEKEPTPDMTEQLREFVSKHPQYIVKPVYAAFGKGVRKDGIAEYASIEEAYAEYAKSGAVLEELIEQAPGMAVIHPDSVNTLRMPTVVVNGDEVRLFHPTLRVGRGDSLVDNFSAGGISALIDPETGVICSDGADKKGNRYTEHPDTHVAFRGFQIPEWDKAVELVKKAALTVPGTHYCGWDLAYGRNGWCMVEANCTAQMGGMQVVTRTGRRAELEELIALM